MKLAKNKLVLSIVTLSVLGVIAITIFAFSNSESDSDTCFSDSDCVAASCCHPTECVPKAEAPDCSDVFCTQECVEGTLDCGQAECKCLSGECSKVETGASI